MDVACPSRFRCVSVAVWVCPSHVRFMTCMIQWMGQHQVKRCPFVRFVRLSSQRAWYKKCCGNCPCRECMVLWKWVSQTNAAEAQAADAVAAEAEAAAGVGNYTYLHPEGGC